MQQIINDEKSCLATRIEHMLNMKKQIHTLTGGQIHWTKSIAYLYVAFIALLIILSLTLTKSAVRY